MKPRYPIYVPSKGRAQQPLTIRALQRLDVAFRVVVEPQEAVVYEPLVGADRLLVTPHRDQGLVVTRNWIWDQAAASGATRFWTFDDNIRDFYRLHDNIKRRMRTPTFLAVIEEFVDRYENVPIAGMHYEWLVKRKFRKPPFTLNTRIYSNMLIDTFAVDSHGKPYRNEGFYNDDTDLCLRVLKDGYCTVLFNAFLADKQLTMTVPGGMTPYYQGDGRRKMAEELRAKHPDVVTVKWKFHRWQHQVDYRPFARNRLQLRPGVVVPESVDEHGMVLVEPHRG